MEILTFFLALIAIVLFTLLYIYIREYFNPMKNLPGKPLTSPFFGCVTDYLQQNCSLIYFIKTDSVKYGSVRKSYTCFGNCRLVISDPYWIRVSYATFVTHVLSTNSKNFHRGKFPGAEDLFLGVGENGLIVTNGEVHKKLRKLASPAFKLSTIKKLMPIIEMCGERMVKLFQLKCKEKKANNEGETEVDVKEMMNKTTLDVIGLIAFGHDFEESCGFKTDTFGCAMRNWMHMKVSLFCILPFQLPIKLLFYNQIMRYVPQSILKDYHTTYKIHDLVDNIIEEKIKQKTSNTDKKSAETNSSKTLLDFILDSNESCGADYKKIHDLLMTFLIAGHETSTLAITWSLYLLTKNPEYQTKCREEVNTFFEKRDNSAVEWDDVKKLTFLNAAIHESLRLYSPVPWLNRLSINPDEIAGCPIPANCDILLIMAEMHRNPDYWINPHEFRPERFLEPHETIPWDAFMPFGDGTHKCIGYQLAMVEIVYFTALLLKSFEFSIDPKVDYCDFTIITMQPSPPLKLFVKPI